MGTLTKMERSPVDVPRPETYFAGKGTLTRVGMSAPGGRRQTTPLPEKNTAPSVAENKQPGGQQTAWNDAPGAVVTAEDTITGTGGTSSQTRSFDIVKAEYEAAQRETQSAEDAVNNYISANMGQLDLKDPAELEALNAAAAAAAEKEKTLEKEYYSYADESYEDKVGGLGDFGKAASTVIAKPFLAIDVAAETAKNALQGNETQNDSAAMLKYGQILRAREDALSETSGAGRFLAEAGLSIADNLYGRMLGMGTSIGTGLITGIPSAADKMYQLNSQGESAGRSLVRGVISGGIEGAAEALSVGNLFKLMKKDGAKTVAGFLAKQAGFEASEEGVTYIVNYIVDKAFKDPNAKFSWTELLEVMGQGGLSGMLFGAGGYATSQAKSGAVSDGNVSRQNGAAAGEKTAPAKAETESTAINTDPAQHTRAEQATIDEYQDSVDDNLVNFVETSIANKGSNKGRYTLKPVSERAVSDIQLLTGVNTSGFKTVIEQRIAEHIVNRHGAHGAANKSMSDVNDVARMQYVIDNYDRMEHGGKSTAYTTIKPNGKPGQADTVKYIKAVNGTYYVVEAVPDTKAKTTYIVSAYMDNKIEASNQHPVLANGPTSTPENAGAVKLASSVPTVTQVNPDVNSGGGNTGAATTGVKKQSMQSGPVVFADSSLTQRMAEAETEYNAAIEQAEAGGEYQLAEALYKEKLRLQDALTEQEIGRLKNELEQYQLRHQAGQKNIADMGETPRNSKGYNSEAIEKSGKDDIISSRKAEISMLNSAADPMADVFGPGLKSNPKEIAAFKKELLGAGVVLIERTQESLGYCPGLAKGSPGTIYVSTEASYSAWLHEMQHMRDDRESGWLGMGVIADPDRRYQWEIRAYAVEIELAIRKNRLDVVKKLRDNLEQERRRIYGE